jgi:hypothetical protein
MGKRLAIALAVSAPVVLLTTAFYVGGYLALILAVPIAVEIVVVALVRCFDWLAARESGINEKGKA